MNRALSPRFAPTTLALLALVATAPVLSADAIPFDDPGWKLSGPAVELRGEGGGAALAMIGGRADWSGKAIRDGVIDLDLEVSGLRSFVYVQFRLQDDGDGHEEFYLRPHKTRLPDAVQYTPVLGGSSQWQLFHGPGATTAAALPPGAPFHVRVAFQGERAAIWIGDGETPALVVPRLAREPKAGTIALRAFTPGRTDGPPSAVFRNVAVRTDDIPDLSRLEAPPVAVAPTGAVTSWRLSPAFTARYDAAPPPQPPSAASAGQVATADPSGMLLIHRTHPAAAQGEEIDCTVAALRVESEATRTVPIELGFSDDVVLYLDGAPVFAAQASYSFDNPRREGLIGYDQATAFLPLAAGRESTLQARVCDGFGGWGLMARFPDAGGLSWRP